MCRRAALRLVPLPNALSPFHWSPPGEPGQDYRLHALQLRIGCQVLLPGKDTGAMLDGVIATNEPLTIFPRPLWEGFLRREPYIEWLSPQHRYAPDAAPGPVPNYPGPDPWIFRDRYPFQLGRVRVVVYDDSTDRSRPPYGVLHPSPVIARFLLEDSPDIPDVVFGLQAGILNNRRMVREPVWDATAGQYRQTWWLEEVM